MKRLQTFIISLAALLFIVLFSGCGQSGPLYVPGDPSRITVPEPENTDDEEEKDPSDQSAAE